MLRNVTQKISNPTQVKLKELTKQKLDIKQLKTETTVLQQEY